MNIVAHNLLAMNAQRQYNISNKKNEKLTEKLSSGYRVNRAADDAAALSISEKMRIQIRGLNKASNNIQDGISYVQVADGALGEVHDMLHRMSELAIQSANDTNTQEDRDAIDAEVQQLKTEIDRIFKTTEFNTRKIWDEVGNNPVETGRYFNEPAVKYRVQNNSTKYIDENNKTSMPKDYYTLNADENGITVSWEDFDGNSHTSDTIPWETDWKGQQSFQLKDYLDAADHPEVNDFKYEWQVHDKAELQDVIDELNGKNVGRGISTSFVAQEIRNDGAGLVEGQVDGVSFSGDFNYYALLASKKDFDNEDDAFIESVSMTNPAVTDVGSDVFSFTFDMDEIGTVVAKPTETRFYSYGHIGDNTYKGRWWDTKYPGTKDEYDDDKEYITNAASGSLDSIIEAMVGHPTTNLQDGSNTGGSIRISFALTSTKDYTVSDYTGNAVGSLRMTINVGKDDTVDSIKNKLKELQGLDLTSEDAVGVNTSGGYSYYYTSSHSDYYNGSKTLKIPEIKYEYLLNIQSSANPHESIKIEYESLSTAILGIHETEVKSHESASETITKVADAVKMVSEQRSLFGAYQNRMEYAKNIAENTAENTQAAESRMRDTDMAKTMTELSVNQILMQAGQAMIAQANQSNQGVLNLLS